MPASLARAANPITERHSYYQGYHLQGLEGTMLRNNSTNEKSEIMDETEYITEMWGLIS